MWLYSSRTPSWRGRRASAPLHVCYYLKDARIRTGPNCERDQDYVIHTLQINQLLPKKVKPAAVTAIIYGPSKLPSLCPIATRTDEFISYVSHHHPSLLKHIIN